jgi:hypothetical protein
MAPLGHKRSREATPVPLTPEDCAKIWRWERHMIVFYTIAMLALIGGIVAVGVWSDIALVRRSVLALILLLAVIGAYVQFREVCPRCGSKLGKQSRFVLPDECRNCGVEFPRPPKKGVAKV